MEPAPEVSAEDFDLSKYSKLENMMSSIKYYFWGFFTLFVTLFPSLCLSLPLCVDNTCDADESLYQVWFSQADSLLNELVLERSHL